jgi:AraC-like DNA-binding protein
VKFWAGGFGAITGLDVGSLCDKVLPLTDVFPDGDRLADLMFTADSDVRRRAVFEAFLHDHLAAPDPSYELVREIVTTMAADRSIARVDEITERFGVPIRTLQRLFRRYVGVGPKWVLRRYRLHDGAELLARGEVAELADLSASLGYFDQAHFSKEFKQQIGLTPAEYATRASAERQITYR